MRIAAILLVALSTAQRASFTSPDGAFVLEHFGEIKIDLTKLHATANGAPLLVGLRKEGVEITAMSAILDGVKRADASYYPTSAHLGGGVVMTQDSAKRYEFLIGFNKDHNLPEPNPAPIPTKMILKSDSVTFVGNDAQGTLTFPSAFTGNLQFHTEGKVTRNKTKVPRVTDNTVDIQGSSGIFTFLTDPKEPQPLQTGTIVGPVKIHFVRNSITDLKPDPQSVIDGAADLIDFDLASQTRTVTLTGNVSVSGSADAYSGYAKATKAVIVLGADGAIQSIDLTGTPTETQIRPRQKGGGGGR